MIGILDKRWHDTERVCHHNYKNLIKMEKCKFIGFFSGTCIRPTPRKAQCQAGTCKPTLHSEDEAEKRKERHR